jgi:protein-L-isoaspartate(D-aspartate) O-methyltransferase
MPSPWIDASIPATYVADVWDDPDLERARARMVDRTIARRGVQDERILEAMRTVPRHLFVPEERRDRAYDDLPLEIGEEQTISQPYIVALMAELARVGPTSKVLDVGTGSGYQAAVLDTVAREVCSIERIPTLYERARDVLVETGHARVKLRCGDGKEGWPEEAPFDAILVAAATPQVPPALVEQLAENGRLVLPVGGAEIQELLVLERTSWGTVRRRTVGGVAFVPLR